MADEFVYSSILLVYENVRLLKANPVISQSLFQ
jgi:hypothetical protein